MKSLFTKTTIAVAATFAVAAVSLPTSDAYAASVRVKCEKQANRSKVSVDGRGLVAGSYKAHIISGENNATSEALSGAGEIEFDFDSDAGNIAAGATAIDSTFIQGGKVIGQIVDSKGHTVTQATALCRAK